MPRSTAWPASCPGARRPRCPRSPRWTPAPATWPMCARPGTTTIPAQPLEQQDLVLTVPASFDEAARALTLEAARAAGSDEPAPAGRTAGGVLRLVVAPPQDAARGPGRHAAGAGLRRRRRHHRPDPDRVELREGEPHLDRIAVGEHLMLGGDNMDLALAHLAEAGSGQASRLQPAQLAQLVERCRNAKERLLADDAPASASVTLLGGGSRLVGGARSVEFTRDEVQHLVVDGFFPQGGAETAHGASAPAALSVRPALCRRPRRDAPCRRLPAAAPQRRLARRAAAQRRRLPVPRHRGAFAGHAGAAGAAEPLRLLHNENPDVAVARGAVAYALARRGLAPRISGGSPRSYFLRLDDGTGTGGGGDDVEDSGKWRRRWRRDSRRLPAAARQRRRP